MLAVCPSTLDTEVSHEDFNDEINIIYRMTDRQMHKPVSFCFLFVKHKILSRGMTFPTMCNCTDKQRICVNTQLKSSKKKLKLNACVQKSNSFEPYAITCDVIAYHLVHFFTIWVIHKCQSGIDFLQLCAQYNSSFMNKISMTSQVFSGKNMEEKLAKYQ